MARIRKTEPEIVVTAAGAAPARRKTATAPRKPMPAVTKAPAAIKTAVAAAAYSPTTAEIAEQAYSYWVARGYRDGCQEEDWLRAERELRQRAL